MKCAGREGSPAMFAFLTGLLLLILAGVIFCDCSGDNDSGSDIEVEKHNETPMDPPTMWISQVSPTSQTPSVTAWSEISEGSQHGSGKGSGNSGGDVVEEISTRQLERELNEDDLQVLHDAAPNYKRNVEGGDAEKHIEVTDHVAADFGEEELQALGIGDKDNKGEIKQLSSGTEQILVKQTNVQQMGSKAELPEEFVGLCRILIGFLQVVSTISKNFPTVNWPRPLSLSWECLAIVNFDAFSALDVNCIFDQMTFYDNFITTIIFPLAVVLILQLFMLCIQGRATKEESEALSTRANSVILFGMFLIYPSVSATILKVWHCREIQGTAYVTADYQLQCWDTEGFNSKWQFHAILAAVAFVVYSLGIPLCYLYLLKVNQTALHDADHPDYYHVNTKMSFLYRSYVPEAWWWETVMFMQKLLLTGA